MALEDPSTLIREIQLTLRREAGVPSYDPADPALPPLPTLREAISSLDPSLPSHLRCRRCRGPLLRGPESTVCIFCGADRRRDAPPQTISFNSTAGCRKLLESLNLDGSEAVALDTESSNSTKGRDTPKEGLVLSGLLDLELTWPLEKEEIDNSSTNKAPSQLPLEKEEIDNSSTNKAPSQSSYALNLSGVDLDTFFSDTKREASSSLSGEQLMPEKQITDTGNHVSLGSQNFGFFENFQSSGMAVSSVNTEGGEFGDSFADWEADFQSASSETFAAKSKSADLFQGSSTVEFASPASAAATFSQQTDIEPETSIKSNSGEPTNDEGQLSSRGNWIQDDLGSQMNKELVKADQFKSTGETINAELKNDLNYRTSVSDSWTQDDLWPTSSTQEFNNTKKVEDDDSPDAWQDFASFGDAQEGLSNSWPQNGTEASGTKELNNTKNVDDNDESLGDWQDFTSSGGTPGGLSNSWASNDAEATTHEHGSGTKSVDLQDMDFGMFLHSDSFTGVLGDQKGSCEANSMQLDPSVSDRMMNGKSRVDSAVQEAADIGENFTAASNLDSSNSNVEKLLSQMHDLSFMLENNLSIPKRVDGSGLNP